MKLFRNLHSMKIRLHLTIIVPFSKLLLRLAGGTALLCAVLLAGRMAQAGTLTWKTGAGEWADAARWGGALPGRTDVVSVEDDAKVTLRRGDVVCSRLDVGSFHKANAEMAVSGGGLWVSSLLRVGETSGAAGRLVQTGGEINALEICVGGANTRDDTNARSTSALEISGGKIFTRHLTLGWTLGSQTTLRISGSKAAPVAVLDYLWIGIRQPEAPSSASAVEMEYELDADGVSPIIVWGRKASQVALIDDASRSTCALKVSLKAAPPSGEIALIQLPQRCRGTFSGLPEGGAVRADFGGQIYEWKISYHGGPAKTDVVLAEPHTVSATGERVAYVAGKTARRFTLSVAEVEAAMGRRLAKQEMGEPAVVQTGLLAFPGAEGYGARTVGGRGGKVFLVQNLNDAGAGSLRAALDADGPRTVLFRVGGTIRLKSPLIIRHPFVTVAGQSAPGEGICIRADTSIHADTLVLSQTHDVILRHLRVENGVGAEKPRAGGDGDCISVYDSENFIIDHCSAHFGTDETLSVTGASDRYTVQWCLISEGLNCEKHSMSSLLGGGRSNWHHNLFAHAESRNPNFAGEPRCDFSSNVIYNWGFTSAEGSFAQLNFAGNYFKPGPSTRRKPAPFFISGRTVATPGSLFLAGNFMEGDADASKDNWLRTEFDRESGSATRLPLLSAPAETAETALARVLAEAGATAPRRDAADQRVIADVRNGTGRIIESQAEVGGWTVLPETRSEVIDSDGDGIPDEWKKAHGLNPNDPADANWIGADGYTNLERYLNSLAPARR